MQFELRWKSPWNWNEYFCLNYECVMYNGFSVSRPATQTSSSTNGQRIPKKTTRCILSVNTHHFYHPPPEHSIKQSAPFLFERYYHTVSSPSHSSSSTSANSDSSWKILRLPNIHFSSKSSGRFSPPSYCKSLRSWFCCWPTGQAPRPANPASPFDAGKVVVWRSEVVWNMSTCCWFFSSWQSTCLWPFSSIILKRKRRRRSWAAKKRRLLSLQLQRPRWLRQRPLLIPRSCTTRLRLLKFNWKNKIRNRICMPILSALHFDHIICKSAFSILSKLYTHVSAEICNL